MKSRKQLTQALNRAYKVSDAIRLNLGLGDDDWDALDRALSHIDHLIEQIADHDARQAQWRSYKVGKLLAYCQAKRKAGRPELIHA